MFYTFLKWICYFPPISVSFAPAASPSAGPYWEYQSMIIGRKEYPTGYK